MAAPRPLVTAIDLLTIAASQVDAAAALFESALGWTITASGPIDRELESLWSIETGSAADRFVILRRPGVSRGQVRLLGGVARRRSRPIAARWSGFGCVAIQALEESAVSLAREMGLALQPRGRRRAGRRAGDEFALSLATTRFERARLFYLETIGLEPRAAPRKRRRVPLKGPPGPHEAPAARERLAADAPGSHNGTIVLSAYSEELVDPERASWTEFDGGPCLATFTSAAFDAAYEAVDSHPDTLVLATPRSLAAVPYGGRRAFCFLGPDGERVEVIEADAACRTG
jgi:catechol 2,3-dioxygenase-like lactoylglutathione lyase family enzyme